MWPPPSRISATGKAFIVLVSLGFLFVFSLVFISVCVPELHKVLSVWGELWFLLFEWCRKTKSEQNTEKMKVGNSFSAEPGISEPFGSVRNILEISSPVFVSFFFFFLLKLHPQGCHHSSSSPRFSSLTPSGLWSSVTMTTVRLSSTWYKPAGPTPTLLTCTASARPSEVNRCDVTWWNRRGGRRLFFFCAATDFYFCFEVEKQTNLHKADRGVRLP